MQTFYFFPIPFLLGLLVLLVILFRSRKRGVKSVLGLSLFGLYLLALVNVDFFPIHLLENWPHNLNWEDTLRTLETVHWIPFDYGPFWLSADRFVSAARDVLGNILLTLPFGFFLHPFLCSRRQLPFWALGVGLTLEGIQLALKLIFGLYLHSTDMTDVLMNALGVMLGSLLASAVLRSRQVTLRLRRLRAAHCSAPKIRR